MKFAVIGVGGLGSLLGARLAADYNEVVFIDHGARRDALAAHGLRIQGAGEDIHLADLDLNPDPDTVGFCDFVLLTVRPADTDAVVPVVRPLLSHDAAVVCLQDGVGRLEAVAGTFGKERVIGAAARVCAECAGAGAVRRHGAAPHLTVGEASGAPSWRQECLVAACIGAGMDAQAADDIWAESWAHGAAVAALSAITALENCGVGEALNDMSRRARVHTLLDEASAVAAADGRELADLRSLADAFDHAAPMPMALDRRAGRPLDIGGLIAPLTALGRALNVPTPHLDGAVAALESL